MALTIKQTLLAIAPEFSSLTTEQLDNAIEIASLQVSALAFRDKYSLAVAYLAAHTLTIGQRSGNSGQVARLKEGELEIQFSTSQAKNYGTTSYLEEYTKLVKSTIFSARTRL